MEDSKRRMPCSGSWWKPKVVNCKYSKESWRPSAGISRNYTCYFSVAVAVLGLNKINNQSLWWDVPGVCDEELRSRLGDVLGIVAARALPPPMSDWELLPPEER